MARLSPDQDDVNVTAAAACYGALVALEHGQQLAVLAYLALVLDHDATHLQEVVDRIVETMLEGGSATCG